MGRLAIAVRLKYDSFCNVLYCTLLYCTVPYCIVVYCIVLYCTMHDNSHEHIGSMHNGMDLDPVSLLASHTLILDSADSQEQYCQIN